MGDLDVSDVHMPSLEGKSQDWMKRFLGRLRELIRSKVKDSDLSADEFEECVKQARSHVGGLARSEKMKLEREAAAFAEQGHSGLMVGCWLPQEVAGQLAIEGGEEAGELHLTLCYCGDAAMLGEVAIAKALVAVDALCRQTPPLSGKVSGIGRFAASGSSDSKDVVYASVDMPELPAFRQRLAEALEMAGCGPRKEHGFTPHVTLAYVDTEAAMPEVQLPNVALRFDRVAFSAGDKRVEIALSGTQGGYLYREEKDAKSAREGTLNPFKLLGEVVLSEDGKSGQVQIFPAVGKYSHPRYGELNITPEFLQTIKTNFDSGVYQQDLPLTIDLEHMSKLSGAAGWIKNVRIDGDKGMTATIEFNDRGQSLVGDKSYLYFSPEFYDAWQDPATNKAFENVLIGGALTNRPFFKGMAPVVMASEGTFLFAEVTNESGAGGGMGAAGMMRNMMARMEAMMKRMEKGESPEDSDMEYMSEMMGKMKKSMPKDKNMSEGQTEDAKARLTEAGLSADEASALCMELGLGKDAGGNAMGLSEEEARQFAEMRDSLKSLNERLATETEARKAAEIKAQAAETEAKAATEQAQALTRQAFRRELAETVRSNRLAFRGEVDAAVDKLEGLSKVMTAEQFKDYLDERKEWHEQMKGSTLFQQVSGPSSSAASSGVQGQVDALVSKAMAADSSLSKPEAMSKVLGENPALYAAYDKEFKAGIKRGGE